MTMTTPHHFFQMTMTPDIIEKNDGVMTPPLATQNVPSINGLNEMI